MAIVLCGTERGSLQLPASLVSTACHLDIDPFIVHRRINHGRIHLAESATKSTPHVGQDVLWLCESTRRFTLALPDDSSVQAVVSHTPPRFNVTFDPHRHIALWGAKVEHDGLLTSSASQGRPGRMSKKRLSFL